MAAPANFNRQEIMVPGEGAARRRALIVEATTCIEGGSKVVAKAVIMSLFETKDQPVDERIAAAVDVIKQLVPASVPARVVTEIASKQMREVVGTIRTIGQDGQTYAQFAKAAQRIADSCELLVAAIEAKRVAITDQFHVNKDEHEKQKKIEETDGNAKLRRLAKQTFERTATDLDTLHFKTATSIAAGSIEPVFALFVFLSLFDFGHRLTELLRANLIDGEDDQTTFTAYNSELYDASPRDYSMVSRNYAKLQAPLFPTHLLRPENVATRALADQINRAVAAHSVGGAQAVGGEPTHSTFNAPPTMRAYAPRGGSAMPAGGEMADPEGGADQHLINLVQDSDGVWSADNTAHVEHCLGVAKRLEEIEAYIVKFFGSPGNNHFADKVTRALKLLTRSQRTHNKRVAAAMESRDRRIRELEDIVDRLRRNQVAGGGEDDGRVADVKPVKPKGGNKQQQHQQSGLASSATQPAQAFPDVVKQ